MKKNAIILHKIKTKIMAKKITLIIGLLIALFGSNTGLAQTTPQPGNSTKIDVPIRGKNPRNKNDRPKSPSRQNIDCIYSDGILSLYFLLPEGEATLTVTDFSTGLSTQYVFDSTEPADIYIGELSAAYIYIETEYGHAYEGEWNLVN